MTDLIATLRNTDDPFDCVIADTLEAQAREIERLLRSEAGHLNVICEQQRKLAAAEEQMKVDRLIVEEARRNEVAAERDAERYRWLRDDTRRIVHIHVEANVRHARGVDVPQAVDAAIDAAREGK